MKIISQNILKILLIIVIMQFMMVPTSQASFWGDIFDTGDNFIQDGKNQGVAIDATDMKNETSKIYNLLFAAGVVLTVIIGAVLGIKLMFAGIEEKAKVKEMLIPYVAGCVVIYGAFGIWKLMVNILGGII